MTAKPGLFAITAAAAIVTFAEDGQSHRAKPALPAHPGRLIRSK